MTSTHTNNNDNTLSNDEIDEIIKNYKIKNYHGCYYKDKLPDNLQPGFYVINLDSSNSGKNGTHWCALYVPFVDSFRLYYDPFGFVPPEAVENKIFPYKFNSRQIQDIDTSSCGFYCIGFIKFLSEYKNVSPSVAFDKFVNLFNDDTKVNERILHSILYN